MFELIFDLFTPKIYKANDFKHLEGSKDVVANLNKYYTKQQFTVKELIRLEKLNNKDLTFLGSHILNIKKLESILLSFYNKKDITHFYSYNNEHAKRLEFRYLMNKIKE